MKITALTKAPVSVDSLERALTPYLPITACASRDELLTQIADTDILVVQNKGFGFRIVDADVLARAKQLKLIQHHGVMYDATDAVAARARGIPLAVTSGSNHASVAEITWHIVLCVAKKMAPMQQSVAEGKMGHVLCTELAGKTICIAGIGRIGQAVARMAHAFDMRVIGVRRSAVLDDDARAAGISAVFSVADFKKAIAQSDVVVLALPLNDATYNLIGEAEFAAMKPGAMLINVSRGNNVNRAALEQALASGKLGGYGSDVWWTEPADPADALLKDPRVYVTPHIGAETREAIDRMSMMVRANIDRLLNGELLANVVNIK
ncbi:MAG: NAD(P)-dependent oxidoreductase [Burkholderiales bacterium]